MSRSQLSRVVTFANGKGGVGKTTCAVNVAGLSAAAGWRTLLIDLDPQGNAGYDLGYRWAELGDDGEQLANALTATTPLQASLTAVRENLDVVSGGARLDDLEDVLTGRARRQSPSVELLADSLAPLAADYDLVVIDTPPTRPTLLQLALGASRWVVVPTKSDRASIEGLRNLAVQITRAREQNRDLAVLGSVLFAVGAGSRTIRRNATDDMAAVLGDAAAPFQAIIRHAESPADQAREDGLLVHELAEKASTAEPFWVALRDGRRPDRVPGSAPALAEDFVLLTHELLTRITGHEDQQQEATA